MGWWSPQKTSRQLRNVESIRNYLPRKELITTKWKALKAYVQATVHRWSKMCAFILMSIPIYASANDNEKRGHEFETVRKDICDCLEGRNGRVHVYIVISKNKQSTFLKKFKTASFPGQCPHQSINFHTKMRTAMFVPGTQSYHLHLHMVCTQTGSFWASRAP